MTFKTSAKINPFMYCIPIIIMAPSVVYQTPPFILDKKTLWSITPATSVQKTGSFMCWLSFLGAARQAESLHACQTLSQPQSLLGATCKHL